MKVIAFEKQAGIACSSLLHAYDYPTSVLRCKLVNELVNEHEYAAVNNEI